MLIMSLLSSWIFLSAFAALTFGLGDFIVVLSKDNKMDVLILYLVYNIVVGILSLLYITLIRSNSMNDIVNFSQVQWLIVAAFSLLYFFAYMSHFTALQVAPNPGYANALIMLHVVILTLFSYYFLDKPLNWQTSIGIIISFIGAYIVTRYANIE